MDDRDMIDELEEMVEEKKLLEELFKRERNENGTTETSPDV